MLPLILISFLLCSPTCTAQSDRRAIGDLQISALSASECDALADSYQAITIRFFNDFTAGCYNLRDVYNASDSSDGQDYTCNPNTCDTDFISLFPENYNPATNYSRAYFSVYQSEGEVDNPEIDLSQLNVQIFESENCAITSELPWYSWGNCNETSSNDCKDLPYSVGSFRVLPTPEDGDAGSCQIGAERGEGVSGKSTSVAVVLVTVVVLGLYMV